MASKRMFSIRLINSARFLKMPLTTQALYFHLGMRADDDGVVEAYNVLKSTGCTEDDLRVLVAKEFIQILNEDLVAYITDWNENNLIRADRKIDSIYKDLLVSINPDIKLIEKRDRADKKDNGQSTDGQWTDNGQSMDGIGKVSIGKDSIEKDSIEECIPPSDKPKRTPKKKYGEYKHVMLTDKEYATLCTDYGEDKTKAAITYLDEYVEMKGYRAKSHYLCMRKWVYDALKEQEQKKQKLNKPAVTKSAQAYTNYMQHDNSNIAEIERMLLKGGANG